MKRLQYILGSVFALAISMTLFILSGAFFAIPTESILGSLLSNLALFGCLTGSSFALFFALALLSRPSSGLATISSQVDEVFFILCDINHGFFAFVLQTLLALISIGFTYIGIVLIQTGSLISAGIAWVVFNPAIWMFTATILIYIGQQYQHPLYHLQNLFSGKLSQPGD